MQRYDTIFNKNLVIIRLRQRYDTILIKNLLIRLGPLHLVFFIKSCNFIYILQYGKLKFYNLILIKEGIFVIVPDSYYAIIL